MMGLYRYIRWPSRSARVLLLVLGLASMCLSLHGYIMPALAQSQSSETAVQQSALTSVEHQTGPFRTDSPRQTLSSFIRLADTLEQSVKAYDAEWSFDAADRIHEIVAEMRALIDLSTVPAAAQRYVGGRSVGHLLDIFGRIDLPDLDQVPRDAVYADKDHASYRIPGTPLRIIRMEQGARAGEFLFSAQTPQIAARFYRGLADKPLRTTLPIESWTGTIPQLTGPLIPRGFTKAIPEALKVPVLDTPIWKFLFAFLIILAAGGLLYLGDCELRKIGAQSKTINLFFSLLTPLALLATLALLDYILAQQLVLTGRAQRYLDISYVLIFYVALAWAIWFAVLTVFEAWIVDPRFADQSLDANMFRLIARLFALVAAVLALAYGLQALGVPVLSVFAGLGIGGLAIALAIRPTLENLIGGFILFIDKPVRVGDYCSFGDKQGTVETIGVRSTQIRALDRTLISIPNSQFVDMQLINWARCDQMMITHTLGLRYETEVDQLRYVLAKIREMLHAHPRIDPDTIRVRFAGYGASSMDIDLRVYAKTREWNDFFAIKEDVLLRIADIVKSAGTGFAFPSSTVYMARDDGLDEELGAKAEEEVKAWRRRREYPFPKFAPSKLEKLRDTLHYPPRGSPDFFATDEELSEGGEQLSAEPEEDQDNTTEGAPADDVAQPVTEESKKNK